MKEIKFKNNKTMIVPDDTSIETALNYLIKIEEETQRFIFNVDDYKMSFIEKEKYKRERLPATEEIIEQK